MNINPKDYQAKKQPENQTSLTVLTPFKEIVFIWFFGLCGASPRCTAFFKKNIIGRFCCHRLRNYVFTRQVQHTERLTQLWLSAFLGFLKYILDLSWVCLVLTTKYIYTCLLYTSPSPRDATLSRMPSSA